MVENASVNILEIGNERNILRADNRESENCNVR